MKLSGCLLLIALVIGAPRLHGAVTIETVLVGNAGNPGRALTGFGGVAREYVIGKYEVTNAQYTEFLNTVDSTGANSLSLYSSMMTSHALGGINFDAGAPNGSKYVSKTGRENNPVVFVSWYDAARFVNWLQNGQGAGSTESGAYTLLGGTATPSNELTIVRKGNARWFLPTEDEWYKAAYHANDGPTGNYWNYAFGSHSAPYSDQPPGLDTPDPSKTGNFFEDDASNNGYNDGFAVTGNLIGSGTTNYLTDVGAYSLSTSPYGTYDQAGNVYEWNETLIRSNEGFANPYYRGWRGGGWITSAFGTSALVRPFLIPPSSDSEVLGFRVAGRVIPEPGAFALLSLGAACFLWPRRQ